MRTAIACLIAFFFTLQMPGQTNSTTAPPILREAVMPRYPPIAAAAHVTGKVTVEVTVKNGSVVNTSVLPKPDAPAGRRLLESPTVENLRTWKFDSQVAGTFTVTYTYLISGTETDAPTNARIEILPSLDVLLTARPVKPTITY
ncbi:TonB family protein [Granulicella sp. S190]|uniref:TonB family protein n=1 Tax=Granulicella sp. S190 TaxID=1747226 RepID=UPI00131D931C|nr:TonB family protein [Granulicella sp. S190]